MAADNDRQTGTAPGRTAVERRPCPICRAPADPKLRPFCSRRCADVDLNRWLSGVYAVPAADHDDEDGAEPPKREGA